MSKWIIEVSEGYGWEEPLWTPRFDTEEKALEFIRGDDPTDVGRWDGQVRAVEEEDED
jgi:hypothetical protein